MKNLFFISPYLQKYPQASVAYLTHLIKTTATSSDRVKPAFGASQRRLKYYIVVCEELPWQQQLAKGATLCNVTLGWRMVNQNLEMFKRHRSAMQWNVMRSTPPAMTSTNRFVSSRWHHGSEGSHGLVRYVTAVGANGMLARLILSLIA